ncbi:MAG TPA: zinc-binding alcohol dehydrogenase family protein [Burkholderiaceae bacterium]|nr:zinc-binding alcohol dehydrogenase family protein [Burkholderiaceae bacterium]
MKAAIFQAIGAPLVVADVPEPVLGTGEVIVDVVSARVLAYAGEVFSGQRRYLLAPPVVPGSGAVGRVRAVGPDATSLSVGDWVLCDPTVRSRDDVLAPTTILQGLTAGDERGLKLQAHFRDGTWAERVRVPTENAIGLGALDDAEAVQWSALGVCLVPYGGLVAAQLRAGETVLVNGATGAFGSAGVAVALAMGAGCVLATGRNRQALEDLVRRFGPRVRPVPMMVREEADRQSILAAAAGPIDCVLDLLPPAASAAQVRAALLAVRPHGRVVLMGGLQSELAIPYAWLMRNGITLRGQWMYARESIVRLVGLVRAGLLRLDAFEVTAFPLAEVNTAIAHAARTAGPFTATVLRP